MSVISLDFLKAFGRFDWEFIFLALEKFSYGENFKHMIKVCYNNIQSKMKINGLLSDPFTLMRVVCQRCPISMLLYIIVAEVLANFIIADTRVKEIEIGNQEIKIVNFAGDTTIVLRDIDSLIRIQLWNYMKKHLTQRWTFLKVNKPKKMEWSNFSIKIICINLDNFTSSNSNWDKISVNISKKIHIWSTVRLSLRGKKLIMNQILHWYIGQIHTIQKYIKKEIEKWIYDFLWEGKRSVFKSTY